MVLGWCRWRESAIAVVVVVVLVAAAVLVVVAVVVEGVRRCGSVFTRAYVWH